MVPRKAAMRTVPAIFIADAPALDFLNSVATPTDRPVDWIDNGEGLLDWLEQAGLVPADVLETFRTQALPGELSRVADQARALREWFRSFVEKHMGRPLALRDLHELEPLDRLLRHDEMFNRITLVDGANPPVLSLELVRHWSKPKSLLFPVGEALAQFVCSEDFSQVKACEGPGCTLVFADHTRGRARRWCSMAICGNRAKQTAYRNRLKTQ
jgi:predicted RNA-binding Zn ribbon-like protein